MMHAAKSRSCHTRPCEAEAFACEWRSTTPTDGVSGLRLQASERGRRQRTRGASHRAEGHSTAHSAVLCMMGRPLGRESIPRNIVEHACTRGRQADAQLSSALVPPKEEHYKGRYEDDRRSKEDHRARRPPTVPMTARAVPQHVREARGRRLRARPYGACCMVQYRGQQTNKHTTCCMQCAALQPLHAAIARPRASRACGGAEGR